MRTLAGTSAVVSGGASGIGAAVARGLSHLGAHVIIADLQLDVGSAVADEIGGTFVKCDVTDSLDVGFAVETACAEGTLRRVVTAAGIGHTERALASSDSGNRVHRLDSFERVLRINLTGTFDMVRQSAAAMAGTPTDDDGERGSIVMLASVEAFDGQAGQTAYTATKSAIAGMLLPLARDFAEHGIRINCVAPGFVDTPIYGTSEDIERHKTRLAKDVLFPRRMGRVDEVADLALTCLQNTYLNAETIRLDGGVRMPAFPPARS